MSVIHDYESTMIVRAAALITSDHGNNMSMTGSAASAFIMKVLGLVHDYENTMWKLWL